MGKNNRGIYQVVPGILVSFFLGASALAASAKSYQVTGPVVDVNDSAITVEKAKGEKWEISRDASSQIPADVKKGDKVTIKYHMVADSAELKGAGGKTAKKTETKTEKTEEKKVEKK